MHSRIFNEKYIKELLKKNRIGYLIKLMNDNKYYWSIDNFMCIFLINMSYYTIYEVFHFMLEYLDEYYISDYLYTHEFLVDVGYIDTDDFYEEYVNEYLVGREDVRFAKYTINKLDGDIVCGNDYIQSVFKYVHAHKDYSNMKYILLNSTFITCLIPYFWCAYDNPNPAKYIMSDEIQSLYTEALRDMFLTDRYQRILDQPNEYPEYIKFILSDDVQVKFITEL